jgi:hypothetical protein
LGKRDRTGAPRPPTANPAPTTMRSPTLSINLSFRSTLAFPPVHSIFPRRAPSLPGSPGLLPDLPVVLLAGSISAGPLADPPAALWARKSCVLTLLRTLFSLCVLFRVATVCFQQLAASFAKTPGWGVPLPSSAFSAPARRVLGGPLRYPLPIDFLPLCFHILTNCFSSKFFIFTTIRIARGVTPNEPLAQQCREPKEDAALSRSGDQIIA